ncbi:AarF/UbiB family protein [Halegenticoccus tardaugens]|uniref:AarF/UbiB family protein n=1 Tax=Halegenticoccus tardaugens TaxID=2071624 RepID=UPI00100A7100|nr:AarF/UbiB family protein [Halegenticoccus tardaugens]
MKIGQVLSTRPDVVPQVYAEEFVTLQDAVPTGPYREMIPALAHDVGYHSYEDFDPEPIAGGSLAQVYRATYQGEPVVVKVRRPEIKVLIETDLRIIRRLIPLIMLFALERLQFSLRNMADDFERIILEELNFEREARMMDEIKGWFSPIQCLRRLRSLREPLRFLHSASLKPEAPSSARLQGRAGRGSSRAVGY